MLSKVFMTNFRCFNGETNIDIAPLTILCGKNSSGKTSILKNILTIKQTVDSRDWFPYLKLRGALIDNGSFSDTINARKDPSKDTFLVGNSFNIFKFDNSKLIPEPRQDYSTFKNLLSFFNDNKDEISKYTITILLSVKKQAEKYNDAENFRAYIGDNHINLFEYHIDAYNSNSSIKRKTKIIYDRESTVLTWENLGNKESSLQTGSTNCVCAFEGLRIINMTIDKDEEIYPIMQNIITLTQIIFSQYQGIHYIGPLRVDPQRIGAIKGDFTSVGTSGEYTSEILAKIKDQKIANNFNFTNRKTRDVLYKTVLNHWCNLLGIPKIGMTGKDGSIAIRIGKQSIKDVGFGISQILPIITECVFMYRNETLLIEQPEVHLHPQMELNLADFFIETVKLERNLIIETHSDHIVNRIMRRMMEDESMKDFIKIYFIDKNIEGQTICSPIIIDKYKGPLCNFDGFFTQYEKEITKMFQVGLDNMEMDNKK